MTIPTGATVNVSGIFLSPLIATDKSQVKQGDFINIFGKTTIFADVVIQVNSDQEFMLATKSDKDGAYLYAFNSSPLELGQHAAKSKAATAIGEISPFSASVGFLVGSQNVGSVPPAKCPQKGDVNNDCRVNLVDFSITAFWWNRVLTQKAKDTIDAKLYPDGKITLRDFSIMAYYWTG